MADKIDPKRLNALDEKLEAVRKANEPAPVHENHYSAAHAGWRMVTELVVGLLLGLGIGFGLDHLFGTQPIFMIVFTMIGFAAGVRTMMRTAEEIQAKNLEVEPSKVPSGNKEMYDDD